jgi:hypothetical protein
MKFLPIGLLCYVGVVVLFESMLGYFQPENQSTFVITTTDSKGVTNDRVLVQNHSNGNLYASANHWPRAWYNEVLEHPRVQATVDGGTADYVAVPVDGAEHNRVNADNAHGFGFKFLVGFAPRKFVRLDPVGQ